jgi:hypothetical protein
MAMETVKVMATATPAVVALSALQNQSLATKRHKKHKRLDKPIL